MSVRIAVMCGSLRKEGFNKKLTALAVADLEEAGAEVDEIDWGALELPIYDGDLEAQGGLPAAAVQLKERLAASRGLLLVSPEYNCSTPGGLKNAIDWASRPPEPPFSGRVCALMGATLGTFGTQRMQVHLRLIMSLLGMWVVPQTVSIPAAAHMFAADGRLRDKRRRAEIQSVSTTLLKAAQLDLPG